MIAKILGLVHMIMKKLCSSMARSKSRAMDSAQGLLSTLTRTKIVILERFQVLAVISLKKKCFLILEVLLAKIFGILWSCLKHLVQEIMKMVHMEKKRLLVGPSRRLQETIHLI